MNQFVKLGNSNPSYVMASVHENKVLLKGSNTQLVRNEAFPPPKFKVYPNIALKGDSSGTLSSIPPWVIMVHDLRSCYMWKIGEICDFEIMNVYDKLCKNDRLKDEKKVVAEKGFIHALNF